MSDKSKISVKAKEGLKVFFPLDVVAAPGRRVKILEGEEVIEVPSHMRFVQRRIAARDLVVIKQSKPVRETKPKKAKKAKPDVGAALDKGVTDDD